MKLAIWANVYDCPYFDEFCDGVWAQSDMNYFIYADVEDAISNGDLVLCLDIDDIPEPELVYHAKRITHDVTAFAMTMFGDIEGKFGKMVDVEKYNVWGFGNTVWKSKVLASVLPVTADWDAVTCAYNKGASLGFVDLPLIRYRMYGQNKSLVKLDDVYVWGENFGSEPE